MSTEQEKNEKARRDMDELIDRVTRKTHGTMEHPLTRETVAKVVEATVKEIGEWEDPDDLVEDPADQVPESEDEEGATPADLDPAAEPQGEGYDARPEQIKAQDPEYAGEDSDEKEEEGSGTGA